MPPTSTSWPIVVAYASSTLSRCFCKNMRPGVLIRLGLGQFFQTKVSKLVHDEKDCLYVAKAYNGRVILQWVSACLRDAVGNNPGLPDRGDACLPLGDSRLEQSAQPDLVCFQELDGTLLLAVGNQWSLPAAVLHGDSKD